MLDQHFVAVACLNGIWSAQSCGISAACEMHGEKIYLFKCDVYVVMKGIFGKPPILVSSTKFINN